jgi:hypothetical protein
MNELKEPHKTAHDRRRKEFADAGRALGGRGTLDARKYSVIP